MKRLLDFLYYHDYAIAKICFLTIGFIVITACVILISLPDL